MPYSLDDMDALEDLFFSGEDFENLELSDEVREFLRWLGDQF